MKDEAFLSYHFKFDELIHYGDIFMDRIWQNCHNIFWRDTTESRKTFFNNANKQIMHPLYQFGITYKSLKMQTKIGLTKALGALKDLFLNRSINTLQYLQTKKVNHNFLTYENLGENM